MKRIVLSLICLLAAAATAQAQMDFAPGDMGGNLPPNHRGIMSGAAPHDPVPVKISVRGIQSTKGGPDVIGDEVLVELVHQGSVVGQARAQLDFRGGTVVDSLRVAMPCDVVVTVSHGGVYYRAEGAQVDPHQPEQKIDVPVYETTDQAPAWQIRMRHVMVERSAEGLHVNEMLSLNNPTDRTWTGPLSLPLPAGAVNVELGNGFDEGSKVESGRIVSSSPLMPGASKVQFGYTMPAGDGTARLGIIAPAPIQNLMVFLPDDQTTVSAQGLELVSTGPFGEKNLRVYQGANLAAGATAMVTVAGLPLPNAAARGMASWLPKVIAGTGAGLILACFVAFVLFRPARKPAAAPAEPPARDKGKKRDKRKNR